MLKILHFDAETTGDDYHIHAPHQLAGGIEINGEIVEEFDFKVAPHPTAIICSKALSISGVTPVQIAGYDEGLTVLRKLCNVIEKHIDMSNSTDKLFISGYGAAHFDRPFLKAFFIMNGCGKFKSYFYNSPIDTLVLAANALRYERSLMDNFKLQTVAERFNIDVDASQLHNAAYDWKVSRLLLHALNK